MGGEGTKKPRMEKLVLPEDMIVEILMILPLKSLLRFKCVSKRWRLLISSKPFIKTRLKNSITDPDLTHHHLIANPEPDRFDIHSRSLRSVYGETEQNDRSNAVGSCNYLRSIFRGRGRRHRSFYMKILGSYNGLILVSGKSDLLIIWNPAIRKANTILPPCPLKRPRPMQVLELPPKQGVVEHKENWKYYSMGYDESTDDYKVVRISITHTYFEDRLWKLANPGLEDPLGQSNSCVETHVYSIRTCSWKKIESSHGAILRFCDYLGKFVNGRLHWLAFADNNYRNQNENRKVIVKDIVCLDLVEEKEKYEIMGGPEHLSSVLDQSQPVLKDLGGYLSLICLASTSELNVWVMMKYGDPGSWTKNLTLLGSDLIVNIPHAMPWLKYSSRALPLWLKKNGDMAVYFEPAGVFVYNGKDYVRKSPVDIQPQLDSTIDDSVICVESLVWPFGDQRHR